METCLPGVRPTEYSRLVARKVMTAAVARVMEPGCKWDHMLVIFGSEGLGKSMWIDRMSRGFSAPLGRLDSKDTLLKLHQSWIMTSDEGHIMRQADLDAQKEFITRTVDTFRMPYDREVLAHPRRCVIWGTTNDEQFLQRQEGNRRFLVVKAEEKVDMDMLTDHYIDQVWAEAVASYRAGEQLWLADDESGLAAEVREQHIEETPLVGLIQEYLDTLVPEEWDDMSPEARKLWLLNKDDFGDEGTEPIRQVCSLQVWVEVLDRRYGDQRRSDLADLNNALKLVPGWKPGGVRRVKGYGPQRVYIRDTPED